MANMWKARQSKLRSGQNKTADLTILETQLMIARLYTQPARNENERIQKFRNINDALDGLESIISGKIRLGDNDFGWNKYHEFVRNSLTDYTLAYKNIERYRRLVSMRYKLYSIVLQSLGYYTNEIVRNELYDSLGYIDGNSNEIFIE